MKKAKKAPKSPETGEEGEELTEAMKERILDKVCIEQVCREAETEEDEEEVVVGGGRGGSPVKEEEPKKKTPRKRSPPKPKDEWEVSVEELDNRLKAKISKLKKNTKLSIKHSEAQKQFPRLYDEILYEKLCLTRHEALKRKFMQVAKEVCRTNCKACQVGEVGGHKRAMCDLDMVGLLHAFPEPFVDAILTEDDQGARVLDKQFLLLSLDYAPLTGGHHVIPPSEAFYCYCKRMHLNVPKLAMGEYPHNLREGAIVIKEVLVSKECLMKVAALLIQF